MYVLGRVAGQAEQLIDQLLALVWIFRVEELPGFVHRGRGADGVEIGPAEKDGIVAQGGGDQAEFAKLGGGEAIDEVVFFPADEVRGRAERHHHLHDRRLPLKAGHRRRLPLCHEPAPDRFGRHGQDTFVDAVEAGPVRDVALDAVAVTRHDAELLGKRFGRQPSLRIDFEAGDVQSILAARRRGSRADPGRQHLVIDGAALQPQAAAVGHAAGWLDQNQALLRTVEAHAPGREAARTMAK